MNSISRSSNSGDPVDLNEQLHQIARWGPGGVWVASILEQGADINCRDDDGNTPLHIAAMYDQIGVITTLVRLGADKLIKNKYRFTPLESVESWEAAYILLSEGEIIPISEPSLEGALYWAIHSDNIRLVIYLMNRFKAEKPDHQFDPPLLSYALREYSLKSIKYFLKAAGESFTYMDEDQNNLLHFAAGGGAFWDIQMLTEQGCDLNAKNVDGDTPLMVAAMKRQVHMVRALAEAGALVNVRNYYLETPIHFAFKGKGKLDSGYTNQIVRELIRLGCDPMARDRSGCTPVICATHTDAFNFRSSKSNL